jgi:thiamine pyrophosphate-dependent acetolactate synthase large subunit-like protein
VVFDNGILGWVKHSQRARGEAEFKSSLVPFDYAGFGTAAGMAAFRVDEPAELASTLQEAVKADRPALVVVGVSTEQSFLDLRSPLMG